MNRGCVRPGISQLETELLALRKLVCVVRRMDAETDSEKPTEAEYQAALAEADAVLARASRSGS